MTLHKYPETHLSEEPLLGSNGLVYEHDIYNPNKIPMFWKYHIANDKSYVSLNANVKTNVIRKVVNVNLI